MPKAWMQYIIQFHTYQDYFECHEILEEYWKEQSNHTKNDIWVGFIALAVSLYHYRIQNYTGAEKLLHQCVRIFSDKQNQIEELGIDAKAFQNYLLEIDQLIKKRAPFTAKPLPFHEQWLATQNINIYDGTIEDDYLWHKHTLRDRSEVIEARLSSLKKRAKLN